MTASPRALAWTLCLLVALVALGGCRPEAAPAPDGALLPTLSVRQEKIERLQLRGAGRKVLVTLERREGTWRVGERDGWPADAGRISQYLFTLSQARRAEPKTSNPALYARLGVQAVDAADATGTELTLSAGNQANRLLVGYEHEVLDANYVRVDGQAQAWLTDVLVDFEPDPVAWLDRRLLDVPLARVLRVRVTPATGAPFALSHRDDRFRLEDAPSAAMRDSHQGDVLAAALDPLRLDDVAPDDGASSQRQLQYDTVDGISITLQAWRSGDQTWMRLAASVDEARAAQWARQAGNGGGAEAKARSLVDEWNARFHGRRFLVSDKLANTLMLDHEQILSGAPGA